MPLQQHFPDLSQAQMEYFNQLELLYKDWNAKINVISRKDINAFFTRHLLHSLSIAKVVLFKEGTKVVDLGTGGGFPGIPLAIMFPNVQFYLTDPIQKKIKVVEDITQQLGLKNVTCIANKVQNLDINCEYIVCRAVAKADKLVEWSQKILKPMVEDLESRQAGGIYCLKGGDWTEAGDLRKEFLVLKNKQYKCYSISDFYDDDFFETKKIIHIH